MFNTTRISKKIYYIAQLNWPELKIRKITSVEKTTSVEDNLSGRQPHWKLTFLEDNLIGQRS